MRSSSCFLLRSSQGFMIVSMLVLLISLSRAVDEERPKDDSNLVQIKNYRFAFSPGDFPALRKLTKAENAAMQEACGLVNHNKIPLKMANAPFVEMGEWPWVVSYIVNVGDKADPRPYSACTGSIVSPWHVISASHCIDPFGDVFDNTMSLHRAGIQAGGLCVGWEGSSDIIGCRAINMTQTRSIKKVLFSSKINHFNMNFQTEDIAIIEVSEPFEFNDLVRPLCVGDLNSEKVYGFTQVGFGSDFTNKSGVLNWLRLGSIELKPGYRFYAYNAYLNYPDPIGIFGGTGTCSGDSGGPTLVRSAGSPRHFLFGDLTGGGAAFGNRKTYCGMEIAKQMEGPVIPIFSKWICKIIGLCREPIELKAEQHLEFLS